MSSPNSAGSQPSKASHPMFVIGPWDIIEVGSNSLKESQLYGLFNYLSSVVIVVPGKGELNAIVDVAGYGSCHNALCDGTVYMLFGRMVQTTEKGQYHFFFVKQMNLVIVPSSQYISCEGRPNCLIGKLAVFGYGVVDSATEVTTPGGKEPVRSLCVTLIHTNYHNLV
ncbi:hypothetical protein PCANC_15807 [Puccinia coronata f. sp. avenae]|uniref:Uncharacterized protein n=1 Tax=Puccinia coronata f. sp. avenae TaxID=200324 RepID=A0A2N5TSX0_9BASI|nr:hypothetical protein PCASD_20672 [Puccinia coronata f. sp. avenae]PLW30759.1 hypothetical protein PCASD_15413 [Puccinia coronata f. sp. avenae]PLW35976.1 hypothetical protein PCANC_15807 [Puccinia coronata f. sp. avenae]